MGARRPRLWCALTHAARFRFVRGAWQDFSLKLQTWAPVVGISGIKGARGSVETSALSAMISRTWAATGVGVDDVLDRGHARQG
jgi:hypothetical protein